MIQLPRGSGEGGGHGAPSPAAPSLRDAITDVARLAVRHRRPLFFIHAPAVTPGNVEEPGAMTRQGLRFAVAIPRHDDAGRLDFGTNLVDLCSEHGYGLWQEATSAGRHTHDYWDEVVPARASPAVVAGASADHPEDVLAVTCAGPARVGSTEALLELLSRAGAPVLGLSGLTLDDIAIIHLLTTIPRLPDQDLPPDLNADAALSDILGLAPRARLDKLSDYRLIRSQRVRRPSHPGLGALWLAWQAPATTDALRLTLETLRIALDTAWARHCAPGGRRPHEGHLNIEYLACRNTTWADRLQGRIQVAIDMGAFSSAASNTAAMSGNGVVTASQLGRFCNEIEHQWSEALSLALGTPYVGVRAVWRESWLARSPGTPTRIWAPRSQR